MPAQVKEEYLSYLNVLRLSGATNMFGAVPYLRNEFPELTNEDARTVLQYWMENFVG